MTTEILYCARCRRVIRPREVSEGRYHFADGEPVCADCFTRLSRRLRPVSGAHEPPKPVDLAAIVTEISEGSAPTAPAATVASPPAAPAHVAASAAPRTVPAKKTAAPSERAVPGRKPRWLVLLAFFAAGALAGAGAYLLTRSAPPTPTAGAGQPQPNPAGTATDVKPASLAPAVNPGGKPVEKAVDKPGESGRPGPSLAGAAVLRPAADAYVQDGGTAANNFGKQPSLLVKKGEVGFNRMSFIRFELGTLSGQPVRAVVRLHPTRVGSAPDILHEARLVADSAWEEDRVTWKSGPSAGAALARWSPQLGKPVDIEVLEAVRAALAGNKRLAIRVESVGTEDGQSFVEYGSREAEAAVRPELLVVTGAGGSARNLQAMTAGRLPAGGHSRGGGGGALPRNSGKFGLIPG